MIRLLWAIALLALPGHALAQGANRTGERAFQRCYSCHSVVKGEKGLSGPNLADLQSRPIASDPEFEYSREFKGFAKQSKRWTSTLLDRFLTNPDGLVPGNQMGFFGINDAKERAEIVAYVMGSR
jgi:cytochrome c2